MKAEFEKLIKVFEDLEEAGATVTLTFSTKGGVSVAKLHLESTSTSSSPPPSTSTGTPSLHPAPGKRRRHRGAKARARRNQRAAVHQASLAEAASFLIGQTMTPERRRVDFVGRTRNRQ